MILQDTYIYGIGLGLGSHIISGDLRIGSHRIQIVVEVVVVVEVDVRPESK